MILLIASLSAFLLAEAESSWLGAKARAGTEPGLVDAGFENGAVGAPLASPPWTMVGSPQRHEYDASRAQSGAGSAWIQGPTLLAHAGMVETASGGMTSNGAEVRFWVYFDTATHARIFEDYAPGLATADRTFTFRCDELGVINAYTERAGNPNGYTSSGYTAIGTYSTGWTEFRVVHTFSGAGAQTYKLWKRTSPGAPWTPLKAAGATGYDIPFRGGNSIAQTHGTLHRGYGSAQLWLDEIRYSDAGINR